MPEYQIDVRVPDVLVVEVAVGIRGPQGASGGSAAVQRVYIQQTEPTPAAGSGPFIWYVLDTSGAVIDIRKGVA